mmetsp:Transcript_17285/g.35095  ORF Transcript_17285/g.35095 Transcript_17285/m.35095 type:complete len:279 (+) Transcript_17285:136-972(+)
MQMTRTDSYAEFITRVVSVHRRLCSAGLCSASLASVLENLAEMLSLPQTIAERQREAEGPPRQFLKFSNSRTPQSADKAPASPSVVAFSHCRDFVLPLGACHVEEILRCICAEENLGRLLRGAVGRDAQLSEVTAIISEPGTPAMQLHSDSSWSAFSQRRMDSRPRMVTLFLALHDILEEAMDPTAFCPETHEQRCFPDNRWRAPADASEALRAEKPSVWFPLSVGDGVVMDSLTWHRGGANTSEKRRVLLAVTFIAASVGQARSEGNFDIFRLCDFL